MASLLVKEKAIDLILDYLLEESSEDVCQKCIYCRGYTDEEAEALGDVLCKAKAKFGKEACRFGFSYYWESKAVEELFKKEEARAAK